MSNVRVYKINNNGSNSLTKENEEKNNENKEREKDIEFGALMTSKSTKIFQEENSKSNETKKKNELKATIKKKNLKSKKMNYIGKIEDAKIHSDANRPLKKLGEFSSQTRFCNCCGLPCEQKGVMEKYSFNDSTEEFIKHGQVISLYFSFYIYSIVILIYVFFSISLPTLILTHERTKELNKICNKIANKN